MRERHDFYTDDLPFADTERSGLLSSTVRNAVVLLGLCLAVAWVMSGADTKNPGPSVASRPDSVIENNKAVRSGNDNSRPQTRAAYYSGDEVIVPQGPSGHFLVDVDVNGIEVRFLVDTGATTVTLNEVDAQRIGLPVRALDFSRRFQTANGEILAAPVTLRDMRIGDLGVSDVDATVTQAPLNISLLGMSFLKRLSGYEVVSEGLVLRF